MVDWTNLPEGLLDLIAEHIHQIKDLIVIDSVCKSWQSALTFDPPKFPLLMLADGNQELPKPSIVEEEDVIRRPRCFFNLFTSKIYEIDLPEAYARKCLGIGFGWMLTFGMDFKINLLHPFLRQQIWLSPESTFTHQYDKGDFANPLHALLKQAVVSCSPSQESCIIMVIYGRDSYLAFARVRSNDKPWIDVQSGPSLGYDDLIYYKEQFYAVDFDGYVAVCNINDDNDPRATSIAQPPIGLIDHDRKYLVESSGDLLLITRSYGGTLFDCDYLEEDDDNNSDNGDDDNGNNRGDDSDNGGDENGNNRGGDDDGKVSYYTKKFLIFKMEEVEDDGAHEYRYKWVKVKDLGNRALFLGNNSSFSFDASLSSLLKPNCIYFTDDNEFLRHRGEQDGNDMGIFNMDNGTIEHYYTGRSYSKYSPPLWYT